MIDQIVALFSWLFDMFGMVSNNFTSYAGGGAVATITGLMSTIATSIKPIGYCLLAVFAMVEFAQLSERVGNVTGFMGAGLVINVLVKLLLAKLVIDNSTEICSFIMSIANNITDKIGAADVDSFSKTQFISNIKSAFPDWWDIFGQIGFYIVSCLFVFLSSIGIIATQIIFAARYIQLYVMTAISPIPLSTCLSKHFNAAPNFLKNLLAVGLQGALLLLVIKIFNIIFIYQLSSVGAIARNDWGAIWAMLGGLLFSSLLLLVSAFQTQRWAKSICHAM